MLNKVETKCRRCKKAFCRKRIEQEFCSAQCRNAAWKKSRKRRLKGTPLGSVANGPFSPTNSVACKPASTPDLGAFVRALVAQEDEPNPIGFTLPDGTKGSVWLAIDRDHSKIIGDDRLWRVNTEELLRQRERRLKAVSWLPTAETLRRPIIVVGRNDPVRDIDDALRTVKGFRLRICNESEKELQILGCGWLLVALVAVALIFDFLNGLDDAANSIATVVSTRVLSPNVAVVWAAFFNCIAFLFFGLHVAQTFGTGIISPDIVDGQVIFGALMGAIVWSLLTWWGAIPSSSSHALIGGLIGAGAAKAGFSAVVWWGTLKTVAAIVWSPLLGFALALLLWLVVAWLLMRSTPYTVDQKFRVLQLGSAALYSIGHGANDAQKTMGIIASLLFAKELLGSAFYVPFWVVLSCQVAMALGTLVGGWRIVKTMGSRITRLKPVQGFCAETAGAMTLYLATSFGVPVSTTHTITGAIMGVGAACRVSAVRWGIAGSIVIAWVITLPAAALIGALFYECVALFAAAA
jgi:PiT family inorganic phosphate transporter